MEGIQIKVKSDKEFDVKAQVFLQRQWELIEGNKKLRIQIPTVVSTLLIAVTAFVASKGSGELDDVWLLIMMILVLLIVFFGIRSLEIIEKQYKYCNKKIDHLYKKFRINYINEIREYKYECSTYLFNLGYASIGLFGLIALIALSVLLLS